MDKKTQELTKETLAQVNEKLQDPNLTDEQRASSSYQHYSCSVLMGHLKSCNKLYYSKVA